MSPAESRHTRERVCPRVVQIAGVEEKCLAVATVRRYRPAHSGEGPNHDLVDVTPSPVLARLNGSNHRVLGLSEVLRSVFVLGRVATANVPALHAQAQMDPSISHFHTVFTHVFICAGDLDLIDMRTFSIHG